VKGRTPTGDAVFFLPLEGLKEYYGRMKKYLSLLSALFFFSSCGFSLPFVSTSPTEKIFTVNSVTSEKTVEGKVVLPKTEKKGNGFLLQKDGTIVFVIPAHLWGEEYHISSSHCPDFQIPSESIPKKISQEDLLVFPIPTENTGKECIFEVSQNKLQKGVVVENPSGDSFAVSEMVKTITVAGKPLRGSIASIATESIPGDSGLPFLDHEGKAIGMLMATESKNSFIMGLGSIYRDAGVSLPH